MFQAKNEPLSGSGPQRRGDRVGLAEVKYFFGLSAAKYLTSTFKENKINILIIVIPVILGIVALLLVVALFVKKQHYARRDIIIDAPGQKEFEYLKLLKNQETFNQGSMEDTDRKKEFKGTDGTVGHVYSWSGNKDAGVGEKEIMNIDEGKSLEMEIRFVKPMTTSARIILDTESISANETKASWSNAGTLKYPVNIMIPMLEKHVVKDTDASLLALKNMLEK